MGTSTCSSGTLSGSLLTCLKWCASTSIILKSVDSLPHICRKLRRPVSSATRSTEWKIATDARNARRTESRFARKSSNVGSTISSRYRANAFIETSIAPPPGIAVDARPWQQGERGHSAKISTLGQRGCQANCPTGDSDAHDLSDLRRARSPRLLRPAQIRLRRKTHFAKAFNPITMSTPPRINISLSFFQKLWLSPSIPPHRQGAFRDRHGRGGGERWPLKCRARLRADD